MHSKINSLNDNTDFQKSEEGDMPCASFFSRSKYGSTLREAGIPTPYDRREKLPCDLFKHIMYNKEHKLSSLLPPKNTNNIIADIEDH